MKFREHRTSLADSMETLVELPDRAALVQHVQTILDKIGLKKRNAAKLKITPYDSEPDDRIGWDCTYIVTFEGLGVLGFIDSFS